MTPSTGGALGRGPTGGPAQPGQQGTTPPFRRILRSRVRMCLSTDAMNVAPYQPFVKLWFATSGRTFDPGVRGVPADQRLTRAQALRASTADCAWNLGQEGRTGSIERGKHADLIVVNRDYFRVPVNEIRNLRSVLTIVGGRVVHARGGFTRYVRGPVSGRRAGSASSAGT
jgi:predicted amidohydrolase YtcJ